MRLIDILGELQNAIYTHHSAISDKMPPGQFRADYEAETRNKVETVGQVAVFFRTYLPGHWELVVSEAEQVKRVNKDGAE